MYSDPGALLDEQDTLEGLPAFTDEQLKIQPSWWNSTYFDEIYHARTAYEFVIRRCLREYGLTGYKVSGPYPATTGRICKELDRGAILYMEVHRHPVYGNHHMLCYGYSVRDGRLMLRMADGWIGRVHDLPAGEELFAFCTVVRRKKE